MMYRGAQSWCLVAIGSLLAAPALAAGKATLTAAQAEFDGLSIRKLELNWTRGRDGPGRAAMRAGRIEGLESMGPLSGLAIDCTELEVSGDLLICNSGHLSGALGSLGSQDTRFSARTLPDGSLRLRLDAFALAGSRAQMNLRIDGSRWELDASVAELDLAAFAQVATPWYSLPEGFTVAGEASGRVQATGRADRLHTADIELTIARLDFADAAGALAGEAVTGDIRIGLESDRSGAYVTDGRIGLTGGQAYSDPVFLDFGVHRVEVDFAGLLAPDASSLEARTFRLVHHDVAEISGSATLDFAGETLLTKAGLSIARLDLAAALPAYVQPFLIDAALKDIEGVGRVHGELDITAGLPSRIALNFEQVTLDSPAGSLSISGLGGDLNWFDDAAYSELAAKVDSTVFRSRLAWESARLWGIEFGAVELPFTISGRHFRLLEPAFLPIFDGGLAIQTLRVRHAGTGQMYVRFDAGLRPISLAPLSRGLGWPEFSGTLAGSIPGLQMTQGIVTLDGNLEAAVFDGRIVVRDLQLRDPLGKFPRLNANVDVDDLDLKLVTNTFSFGMITGRLSGRIEHLETFAWMPESFDARFYTPPGDRSPHRISQRAVTNLSSIGGGSGGGVAAALQGGFLKFFDEFRYDRLGLSCRLANDVCTMSGIERTGGSYYIVKGAGLPRIDVIGSQSRVAWTRLVRQLGAIMESEIVIE